MKTKLSRAIATLTMAMTALVLTAFPAAAAVNPNPQPNLPGGLEGKMNTLLGLLMGIAIFACVAGIIICGILMAVASRRGSMEDHFGRLAGVMIACVLIGGAAALVMFLV